MTKKYSLYKTFSCYYPIIRALKTCKYIYIFGQIKFCVKHCATYYFFFITHKKILLIETNNFCNKNPDVLLQIIYYFLI